MSLDFDLSGIKDYETKCHYKFNNNGTEVSRINPVTEALIFATMFCGIGRIEEANAEKFHERLNAWEKCVGSVIFRGDGYKGHPYITLEEVQYHIGLRTNVSTLSDAQFRKDLVNAMFSSKGLASFIKR